MTGRVENLHALLPVVFHLPNQSEITLEFVVDTGFTDALTLPLEAVVALRLPFDYNMSVNLAHDTDAVVPVHRATIIWQGSERTVRVFATGRRPLLGTALLGDCELTAQFRESGLVLVELLQGSLQVKD